MNPYMRLSRLAELPEVARRVQQIKAAEHEVMAMSVDGLGDDKPLPQRAAEYLESIDFPLRSGSATQAHVDRWRVLHNLSLPVQFGSPM